MNEKLLSVGTNMHKARVYLKNKGYEAKNRQKILDSLRTDIPNVRNCNCKFLLGVTRLFIEGEISTGELILGINNSLRFITDESHVSEYDFNLNGLSADTIIERFKLVSIEEVDKDRIDSQIRTRSLVLNQEYTIVPINSFKEAEQYKKYTTWCITGGQSAFDSYTFEGRGKFYFCLRKGFEKERRISGENSPLDNYGLSMIAVSVSMTGECNTVTCRWNHDNDGNDSIMTVEGLEELLGGSFYTLFPPHTKEYLKEHNLYISTAIGKYYLDMKTEREGIIAAAGEDDNPIMILSLDQQKYMTWVEAMEYNKTLTSGWHLPDREEAERIWCVKGYNNIITKKLNLGIKRYNVFILNKLKVSGTKVIWEDPSGVNIEFDANKPIII